MNVLLEGLSNVGSSKGPRIKRLISISDQDEWDNHMSLVMDNEVRALNLFVLKILREVSPNGWFVDFNNSLVLGSPVIVDYDDVCLLQVVPSEVILT